MIRRLCVILAVSAMLIVAGGGSAAAHPLGNFSVNRFSGIEVFPERVVVHYVVDMAEVPTFQETPSIDLNGDDAIDAEELDSYAAATAEELAANLSLSANGEIVPLTVEDARAGLRGGGGGLDILRMDFAFAGVLPDSQTRLNYEDSNYPGHLGWREVVAYGTGGQGIAAADVPSESTSNELRSYPRDLLSSPPDVKAAVVEVAPGAAPAPGTARAEAPEVGAGDLFAGAFSSLIERDLSPTFLLFAVVLALTAGALHALGPGHGKTIMAAYLVGTEGRARHAVAIGIAISLMHTASVIGLCLITLWAQNVFAPEAVYPWLSLLSGVVVLSLGAWLLVSRLRARAVEEMHSDHAHDHSHLHGHDHSHGPLREARHSPLSWRGLVALALSGGLLPSPTALVVLLGAVALHRIAFGFVLVLCFSIGLAGALTLMGILVLRARDFTARRLGKRSAAVIPILSAAAIAAMGLFLTTRAAMGF